MVSWEAVGWVCGPAVEPVVLPCSGVIWVKQCTCPELHTNLLHRERTRCCHGDSHPLNPHLGVARTDLHGDRLVGAVPLWQTPAGCILMTVSTWLAALAEHRAPQRVTGATHCSGLASLREKNSPAFPIWDPNSRPSGGPSVNPQKTMAPLTLRKRREKKGPGLPGDYISELVDY